MATLIKMDGSKTKVEFEGEFLSISQISKILNCVIEPLFFGDVWAFSERFVGQQYGKNESVSKAFSADLYGDVILAADDELSPTFFFPPELKKDIQDMSRSIYEAQKAKIEEIPESSTEDQIEQAEDKIQVAQEKILKLLEKGYDVMSGSGKSFKELTDDLDIFQIPGQDSKLEGATPRIHYLKGMIEHFTKKEEYEKCAWLADFIKYIESRNNEEDKE